MVGVSPTAITSAVLSPTASSEASALSRSASESQLVGAIVSNTRNISPGGGTGIGGGTILTNPGGGIGLGTGTGLGTGLGTGGGLTNPGGGTGIGGGIIIHPQPPIGTGGGIGIGGLINIQPPIRLPLPILVNERIGRFGGLNSGILTPNLGLMEQIEQILRNRLLPFPIIHLRTTPFMISERIGRFAGHFNWTTNRPPLPPPLPPPRRVTPPGTTTINTPPGQILSLGQPNNMRITNNALSSIESLIGRTQNQEQNRFALANLQAVQNALATSRAGNVGAESQTTTINSVANRIVGQTQNQLANENLLTTLNNIRQGLVTTQQGQTQNQVATTLLQNQSPNSVQVIQERGGIRLVSPNGSQTFIPIQQLLATQNA